MTIREFKPGQFPGNAVHISLDLETAGVSNRAPIVEIGACVIGNALVYRRQISLWSNEQVGLVPEKETMEWWDKQDPALRAEVFSGNAGLHDVLMEFKGVVTHWCEGDLDRAVLWGNGVGFDNAILKHAWELFESWPFNFRNDMDLRTLKAVTPVNILGEAHKEFMRSALSVADRPHSALSDAIYQGQLIGAALDYLLNPKWP